VKPGSRWDSRFHAGLRAFRDRLGGKQRLLALGVYDGPRRLVLDDVRVMPWRDFLGDLWSGALVR
jgi:hypothetical protein